MIKRAYNLSDMKDIIELVQEFLLETTYSQAEEAAKDREHLGKMIYNYLRSGVIWIAYDEDTPVGLLIANVEKNTWIPTVIQLREIVFFVKQSHRNSLIGGRLFAEYCKLGNQLIDEKQINVYFTTKMSTTSNYNLEKRGFRKTEELYIKEKI